MKIALAILIGLAIAGSIAADYAWKRWIAARKRERE